MEFLKPKGVGGATKVKQQLLTVGDAAGNLHVYDVPQNLWRPLTNERALMSNFLERETKVRSVVTRGLAHVDRSPVEVFVSLATGLRLTTLVVRVVAMGTQSMPLQVKPPINSPGD